MAAPPFKVKAIYEYTSQHDDDLTFPVGQVITVTELEGDDWYVGEYTDVTGGKHEGLFPTNFVEKYEPEVPSRPTRPSRPKQEAQPLPAPAPAPAPPPAEEEPEEEDEAPTVPAASKPSAPAVEIPPAMSTNEQARSASSQKSPAARAEPPAAPKPTPAEPAEPTAAPAKKAPPPVAAKSNAFKDRIAAFNQPAATPLAPMQPGRQPASGGFIKKPFVAPPPSKNAYVPPPAKVEPVHKPYIRDEDPEIKEREEEDRIAAQAAGLVNEPSTTGDAGEDEDTPKPMTLKERMAMLQKQQQEQAQRRADAASSKKEKKAPQKKASESSDYGNAAEAEPEELERVRSDGAERQHSDMSREKPRVPSTHRRPPELTGAVPAPPEHEILSDGHEADQSGAGEMTEDDSGTLGPDEGDERSVEVPRHPVAPKQEPHVGEEEDTTEGDEGEEEEEDEVDEETRRKEELRARMARLGGSMPGMGAPFNPFGAPPPTLPKKKQPSKERKASASEEAAASQPQQRVPMVPVPGMQRIQSLESDTTQKVEDNESDEDEVEQPVPKPPSRTATMERGAPPPVPKGISFYPASYS